MVIAATDAQFIETRRFSIDDVERLFSVKLDTTK